MGGDVIVTSPRLVLRQMTRQDAPDLCRIVTQPQVGRMLFMFPPDWTDDAAATFIEAWTWRGQRPFRLAISDGSGRFLGSVGVWSGEEPEVFYFLDPAHSGQGLGSEAIGAFCGWLFGAFGLSALRAGVFDDNPASRHILLTMGFQENGRGKGTSAARLEPAPITFYRLQAEQFRATRA